MRKVINFLFSIFCFLVAFCPISWGAIVSDTNYIGQNTLIEKSQEQVAVWNALQNETQIVASNFANLEIFASVCDRKDAFANGTFDRTCAQNKDIQQISNIRYNQSFLAKSHNISSYLKNEICTRAP